MLSTAVRTSLVVALGCTSLGVLPSTAAHAALLEAVLVASHSTASDQWGVPSPDPSGIAYDSVNQRLVITDGEVEEMPLYAGTNLFLSTLDGRQDPARVGGTSVPWSLEPVGAGFRAADGHLFVSDDDADRIFEVSPGADGVHGTPDDTEVTSFSTRGVFGSDASDTNGDAEGVALDLEATSDGHLFVIDGTSKEVYEYGPGPDGEFNGVGDTVTSFDMQRHGALDPEGIEVHPGRGTLLVLDSGSRKVYEVDRQGALLNAISIAAAMPVSAAGMTLAPASDGSGAQNLYIVDRGVDNDTDPTENDGRFYEMAVTLPPLPVGPPNVAPTAVAGPDVTVTRPAAAVLAGSMTDDGLPTTPGMVTAAWTKRSGPGDVTFANAASASTTATFSAPGNYVLRLTVDDGGLTSRDEVAVVVREADGSGVLDVPVRTGGDDAEERSDRTILTGADLELIQDGTAVQKIGLRFTGVALPQGATIRRAYVQFTADEVQTGTASLIVAGQAADDAAMFTTASKDVSGRPRTEAAVSWDPVAWPTIGARDVDQRTPDLTAVVQEIVNRPGWTGGNALALVVTGTGTRTAAAFERGAAKAPVLHVEYGPAPGSDPVNAAPTVDAGPDVALTLPAGATLAGSVADDGLPVGAPVTAAWTVVSGPGPVTFAAPAETSTAATFGVAGTYVLRLTGSDGLLTASDEVTVTVAPVPVPTGSLDVRVVAAADDAEERSDGRVTTNSADLTLGREGSKAQTVGLRFAGVTIPAGAVVTNAHVQFQADATTAGTAGLTVVGQAADDASGFTSASRSLSSRPTTAARVAWAPGGWSAGMRGTPQRTPDLTPVVREIVSRPGWAQGNALVLVVTGSGTRVAEAFEGGAATAPVLHLEYGPPPGGGPGNAAPTVDAGPDVALTLPAGATLSGSVADDGLPVGARVTAAWTVVSGPAPVTFAAPSATSTAAAFGAAGTYVLRLTGSDGLLTASDEVTVTVSPAPVLSGSLDVRIAAGGDDAEERSDGKVTTNSGELTLGRDGSKAQTVGLRFTGIAIPAGSVVTNAYVQFQADATTAGTAGLTIAGQASDDASGFTSASRSLSSRPTTAARADWAPGGWSAGMRGTSQRTPDLTSIVREVVSRPGWAQGNALVLVVTGSGTRVAEAFEGGSTKAPVLHIEYGPASLGG